MTQRLREVFLGVSLPRSREQPLNIFFRQGLFPWQQATFRVTSQSSLHSEKVHLLSRLQVSDDLPPPHTQPEARRCVYQPSMQCHVEHSCDNCTDLVSHGALSAATVQVSSVQSLSHVWLFVTPWTAACQASQSNTNSRSLLKLMPIEPVMPSSHLILCRPLLLPPLISPSIRVFSNELALRIRWPKYWSFSFSISPSKEYSGLISFRMDWLDLLAVQGTLKSLLQHQLHRGLPVFEVDMRGGVRQPDHSRA